MARLIDADALIGEMHSIILEEGEDRRIFYEVIERQPTIEQPGIIRCKDCKHWGEKGLCGMWDQYISNGDFYCGCAETMWRREQ